MKKIYIILTAAFLTACVNDLDTLPPVNALPIADNVYGKT